MGTTVFRDLHDYLTSLRLMGAARPGRLYPAHGPVVERGVEKIAEYLAHRQARKNIAAGVTIAPPLC